MFKFLIFGRRTIIIIHLFLVIITVTHLQFSINNRYFQGINTLYSAYSNTNRCFGFFAPEVYSDLTPRIITYDRASGKDSLFTFDNPNFESRVRLYSLMGHFGENNDIMQMDLFSRCWGLKAFNSNPDVDKIDVVVYRNFIPTMAEYRKGSGLQLDSFYYTHLELDN